MKNNFYDITEVCRLFKTTSRTLRYYEEKKLISSVRNENSKRRYYTEEELTNIKNIFILRKLGLSIKSISELQAQKCDLKEAISIHRAELCAAINDHREDIVLLDEALGVLESEKDIFDYNWQQNHTNQNIKLEIAEKCTDAILNDNDELLYRYFTPRLKQYMPKEIYNLVKKDTLKNLGDFIEKDEIYIDKKYPSRVFSKIKFSNLGLMVTLVFSENFIDGFWLGYYNYKYTTD